MVKHKLTSTFDHFVVNKGAKEKLSLVSTHNVPEN